MASQTLCKQSRDDIKVKQSPIPGSQSWTVGHLCGNSNYREDLVLTPFENIEKVRVSIQKCALSKLGPDLPVCRCRYFVSVAVWTAFSHGLEKSCYTILLVMWGPEQTV